MGVVYLSERRGPEGFSRLCVVKVLKDELADDPEYRDMFVDEARLAARLRHRNIVETYELDRHDGRWFMAMELLEGMSLHDVRTRLGAAAIGSRAATRILVEVLGALDHAHGLGVVHRDVSALNVFLTWDGDVKLIDFGVAKTRQPRHATKVGVVKGSVPYLSPDHFEPDTIDGRADVFSAGVLLRELCTGERLWGSADDLTVLRRLLARDVPAWPTTSLARNVPGALRRIIERAMAPRREDRYASAREMRAALEAFLSATDTRGSLADVGAWLRAALPDAHAAWTSLVAEGRASLASPPPAPRSTPEWLSSSALETALVGVPPSLPSPLSQPSLTRAAGFGTTLPTLASLPARLRTPIAAGLCTFLFTVLVLALASTSWTPSQSSEASATRTPRIAEDIATELAVTNPPSGDTLAIAPDVTSEASPAAVAAARLLDSRRAVENATVPPNPYE